MEHLVSDSDFAGILDYYAEKYHRLLEVKKQSPASACVILLCATVDVALRTVFGQSEEDNISDDADFVDDILGRLAVIEFKLGIEPK